MTRTNEHGQPVGEPVHWAGAREPDRTTTLSGRLCSLVPLRVAHAPDRYAAVAPGGAAQWTYLPWDPPESVEQIRMIVEHHCTAPGFVPFAILDGSGIVVGTASYLRVDARAGSIEVGAILYGTALRRTAAATEAMLLLARHAIDELGFRRYEWKCDDLNAASRAAAERLGFRFEGVFRQAMVYKGRNRDTAWYAITDRRWPAVRAAWQAWLDPANFGPDGRQRARLARPAPPG